MCTLECNWCQRRKIEDKLIAWPEPRSISAKSYTRAQLEESLSKLQSSKES